MADNRVLSKPWSTKQGFILGEEANIPSTPQDFYLYNIHTKKYISIPVIPETLSESYSQNIVKQTPYGVIHPLNFYTGGSEKKLSFSIDVHEDVVGGNLYNFTDRLKRMSYPKIEKNTVRGPSIYFQLGEQFAGKGHITSEFNFKKPFVDGRYKLVTISISFVFHELFRTDNVVSLFDEDATVISEDYGDYAVITSEDYDSIGGDTPIEDFISESFGDDYLKNSFDFITKKVSNLWASSWTDKMEAGARQSGINPSDLPVGSDGYFEALAEWFLTPTVGEEERETREEFLNEDLGYWGKSIAETIQNQMAYGEPVLLHPYISRLLKILQAYYTTLLLFNTVSYSSIISRVAELKEELEDLVYDYLYVDPRYSGDLDRGVLVESMLGDVGLIVYKMSESERRAFENVIGYPTYQGGIVRYSDGGLKKQMQKFLDSYEFLTCAGG